MKKILLRRRADLPILKIDTISSNHQDPTLKYNILTKDDDAPAKPVAGIPFDTSVLDPAYQDTVRASL